MDEGAQQFNALLVIEHDDFNAELREPIVTTVEGRRFTNDHTANVELSNEA